MKPHEERMVNEQDELLGRINKIYDFMTTDTYGNLDSMEKVLLSQQVKHMCNYSASLGQRILNVQF